MAFHALLPPQDYMYSWLSRCSTAGGLVVVVVVDDWNTDHRRWLKEVSSQVGTTLKKNVYFFIRRPLGSLNYLRVWHDNTGWENYASWFITAIVVRDVQTDEKFEFIINNWLAVDKGDGEVKHSRFWHPRATVGYFMNFSAKMMHKLRRNSPLCSRCKLKKVDP